MNELLGELEVTLTRQHRFGDQSGGTSRSATKPLPFHTRASKALEALRHAIGLAVYDVGCPLSRMGFSTAHCAEWLRENLDALRVNELAGEVYESIRAAIDDGWRAVDHPPRQWYAGACACGTDLYGQPSRAVVKCGKCGAEYEGAKRREELRALLPDQLAPAADIARGLSALGEELSLNRITQWARRGKLTPKSPHPNDPRKRPRYRVGDVQDLLRGDRG
ncbi:hypothetical protein [Saccharopolyspora mangrovi]|uniref:Transposase n=1 Tax=Saccharopolyspora mangrovi TaxID=3082379 RepID=A0ABU6A7G5_9PSEU|nr:hypothetical protein [Saccharopolyspora sp. S2-29]MEB3367398.1 hypothetical protein [Saccharopolyspora sp. S2-29]